MGHDVALYYKRFTIIPFLVVVGRNIRTISRLDLCTASRAGSTPRVTKSVGISARDDAVEEGR